MACMKSEIKEVPYFIKTSVYINNPREPFLKGDVGCEVKHLLLPPLSETKSELGDGVIRTDKDGLKSDL